MDLGFMAETLRKLLEGVPLTLNLAAASVACGAVLAMGLASMRMSGVAALDWIARAYVFVFRGTPLLVQLFMIYYGAAQFAVLRESFVWPLFSQAWFCALLAFTLNTAAYTTEIIRGAIEATPHGEVEAARACGMSPSLMVRRILLPSAFRRALPAYGNEVIFMLHGSAVASVITIVDLTGAARIINSRYYSPYEAFITAALFYMALTFLIVAAFRLVERRWFAHLRPRSQ